MVIRVVLGMESNWLSAYATRIAQMRTYSWPNSVTGMKGIGCAL